MASITDQMEVICVTIWHRWRAASGRAQSVHSDEPGEVEGGQARKEEEKQTEEEERERESAGAAFSDSWWCAAVWEAGLLPKVCSLRERREGDEKSERNK